MTTLLHRDRRDHGSVSILFAVGLTAVMLIIGLSVDAGGRLRAAARAQDLAAAAARTGAQQINLDTAIPGGTKQINPTTARTAIQNYLAAQGATGVPTFTPNGQQVTVTVTVVYQTQMLFVVGIKTFTVIAKATATLLNTA